jgi:hypothetical protein
MRAPLRRAWMLLLVALAAAAVASFVLRRPDALGALASVVVASLAGTAAVFTTIGFVFALLAGVGEARLRRGIGIIAQWQVPAAAWESFRAYDARRTAEHESYRNEFSARPAEGKAVEVVIGRRQAMVDGSYHALRHGAVPSLVGLRWLQPEGAPECLEFGLAHARGRYSAGLLHYTLRLPVPHHARKDGVRVFEHFRALLPAHDVPLAFRRPGLFIGWGLGIAALGMLAALAGWLLHVAGQPMAGVVLVIGGFALAGSAWIATLVLALAVLLRRRAGRTR